MKRMFEKVSKNLLNGTPWVLILFLTAGMATVVSAQEKRLNDDLKPRKTNIKKLASKSKSKPAKPVVKPKSKPKPKPKPISKPKPKPAPKPRTKSKPRASSPKSSGSNTPLKKYNQPPESTVETLQRYMDYEQSKTVTKEDWQRVSAQTTQVLLIDPKDLTAKAQHSFAKGQLALYKKDYINALIHFNVATQTLPASALPHYGKGQVYLANKKLDEAEDAFKKSIKIDEDFALAYNGMAQVMKAKGNIKKSEEYYNQAGQIILRQKGAKTMDLEPKSNLSDTEQNSDVEEAQEVVRDSSSNIESKKPIYVVEIREAQTLSAQRKWQKAVEKLTELSKSHPTSEVYILIGNNYSSMKKWLSALQSYQKASEVSPESAMAFYKTGEIFYELNEYRAASESFEKALVLDTDGNTIDRKDARKMADKAKEKAEDLRKGGKKKKFLGIGL